MYYDLFVGTDKFNNELKHFVWESDNCTAETSGICGAIVTYYDNTKNVWNIPEGVKELQGYCFYEFDAPHPHKVIATEITLPKSLSSIGHDAFHLCRLRKITVSPENEHFIVKNNGLYSADGKKLIYIFYSEEKTLYEILDGTEEIDSGALYYGRPLKIPASVKRILDDEYEADGWDEIPYIITEKGSYAETLAKQFKIEVRYI